MRDSKITQIRSDKINEANFNNKKFTKLIFSHERGKRTEDNNWLIFDKFILDVDILITY